MADDGRPAAGIGVATARIDGPLKVTGEARYGSDLPADHCAYAALAVSAIARGTISAIDPTVDMKTPPKVQVDTMPAGKYFAYAADLLKLQPPHVTDQPIVARMKRIGPLTQAADR